MGWLAALEISNSGEWGGGGEKVVVSGWVPTIGRMADGGGGREGVGLCSVMDLMGENGCVQVPLETVTGHSREQVIFGSDISSGTDDQRKIHDQNHETKLSLISMDSSSTHLFWKIVSSFLMQRNKRVPCRLASLMCAMLECPADLFLDLMTYGVSSA
ncbi:hypothetical protein BaRGS_00020003 [Batillaria attramentaria]|uniref:Uncharacterized protein n=1 Tax=Batillaria attramentaria TaxID=370345 RepID=A0ABD0KP52_9CAEN